MQTSPVRRSSPDKMIYVLVLVIIVQTIYPLTADGSLLTQIIYSLFYASLIVSGIVVAREQRQDIRLLTVLGATWFISSIIYNLNQHATWARFLAYGAIIPYQIAVTRVLLLYIFASKKVTRDVIYAAAAVYILIGAIFVPTYGLIETITYEQTGTNAFVDTTVEPGQVFPWQNFAYFSYVTLTTLGFGDIQPVTLVARAAVTIESVIGVFYTTVIMARLVSLYTAQGVEAEIKHDHTQTG
ncbi:MAG: hypothetical protein KC708_22880 [Anaerolineae bacterium]|nr:hypothetical protein [Anaerolineae bacterium]